MKIDARVRYTRKVICDSFIELMREKPINKITVKEICDAAQINRATFYKHYQDVYDLMEALKQEALVKMDAELRSMEVEGVHSMLVSILTTLRDVRLPFDALAMGEQSDSFVHQLMGQCFEYLEPRLGGELPADADEQQRTMLYAYLCSGSVGVIECWMHGGAKESPEEIAVQIEWLTDATAQGLRSALK